MKVTKTVKIIEPVPRRVPPIQYAGRKRRTAKIVGSVLLGLGLLFLMFGVGSLVSAVWRTSGQVDRLSQENETLWQRIEMLEEDRDYHEEYITSLEEDVEELEGQWVDADTFEVSDETGKCEGIGFRIGDSIYLPTGPCKDESPFAINNDKEFDAMASALLAAYKGDD